MSWGWERSSIDSAGDGSCYSLLSSTMPCRSGWTIWKTLGDTYHHRQQSPGDGETNWQGPKVTGDGGGGGTKKSKQVCSCPNFLDWPRSLCSIPRAPDSWLLIACHRLMRYQERPPADVVAVRAWCPEAVVITTAHFPWDGRCAFPRRSMQEHAWSPHGSQGAAGLVINSSWGPGMDAYWKWLGLRSKVRLGREHPGASLAPL